MKLVNIVKDYLSFNKAERRGLFVLIAIMTGMLLANMVISEATTEQTYDIAGFSEEIRVFEMELARADSLEKMKYQQNHSPSSLFRKESLYPNQENLIQKKEEWTIELNSADTFDLQRLRGIGPAFARRIVKYRERLGGFTDREQLLEVYGMDHAKYDLIQKNIVVSPDSLRQIDLNTVTFKELSAHPYFPFAVTKNVMIYRKEHKRFTRVDELLKVQFISDSLFRKMKPYVRVD